mgnify:FL=1
MGLFKKFKELLPTIGGAVGFAIAPGPIGAAIGSGIGSLAAGKSVEDALTNAAIGGAVGYGAGKIGFGEGGGGGIGRFVPSFREKAMMGFGNPLTSGGGRQALAETIQGQIAAAGGTPTPEKTLGRFLDAESAKLGLPGSLSGQGVTASKGFLDSLSFGEKAALGIAGLGLVGGLLGEEEEEGDPRRPDGPPGQAFGTVVGRSGKEYDVSNPTDMKQYAAELRELQKPGYDYYTDPYRPVARSSGYAHGGDVHAGGGEVDGPGTGTSDSVPARLSDGEFVLTAKAVRGAGGGDRDIGAARLYDMMSELEATG